MRRESRVVNFVDDLLRWLLTRGTGCPRNEFIKYFIQAGRRESRNDAGDGDGVAAGTKARENGTVQKDPFYNSPLPNNPLRDVTENVRVTPT